MGRNCLVLFFTTLAFQAFSQERLNKISANPIQLFGYNRLNLEYERGFNEGKLGISFYYGKTGNSARLVDGYRSYLSEQNFAVKFYPKSMGVSGFWYGGQMTVASGDLYGEKEEDRATNIGALGVFGKGGYQLILKSFYLDLYGGIGYALTNDLFGTAEYFGEAEKPNTFLTLYGIKLGIAF